MSDSSLLRVGSRDPRRPTGTGVRTASPAKPGAGARTATPADDLREVAPLLGAEPRDPSASSLAALQRLAGNAAVGSVMRTVQRSVPEGLATSPATERLATQLDDEDEEGAIATFEALGEDETDTVLRSRVWQDMGTSAFGNETMHRAMVATGSRGLLFSKLLWEFDEGTDFGQVRELVNTAPEPQRRQVITEPWFRDEFTSICDNETMGIAVRLLGPPLVNQLDWMIEEGVDEPEFVRLIEQSAPDDLHEAARDEPLMSRLRDEVPAESRVFTALVSAGSVSPEGETAAAGRWTEADAAMLRAATRRLGVIGARAAARVPAAVNALDETSYEAFRTTLGAAGSDTERAYICKGLAAGHTITELEEFALLIRGMSDDWLLLNLNVVRVTTTGDTSSGAGIIQQFHNSCGPTSVQTVVAQSDPVYALTLNSSGPIGAAPDFALSSPETVQNDLAAAEQGAILNAHAMGNSGNAPEDRELGGTQTRGGAWVEDDMNARRAATGVTYERKNVPGQIGVEELLAILTVNLGMGIEVPIIVGQTPGAYSHYVVVIRKEGDRYQIHDVWAGQTVWRTSEAFRSGTLNLPSNHLMVTAVAEPTLAA